MLSRFRPGKVQSLVLFANALLTSIEGAGSDLTFSRWEVSRTEDEEDAALACVPPHPAFGHLLPTGEGDLASSCLQLNWKPL